ncbi:lipopolysaccharide assembly protein LapA domain-containing protein [Thermodesulfobacteriota bacterium]
MKIKLITALIFLCVIVIFFIQNASIVEIKILFWTITMSRTLLMLLFLAIGIVAGWLLKYFSEHFKHGSDKLDD